MRTFRKKLFLQKIKQQLIHLTKINLCACTYRVGRFSEWLEFKYGNYYYVFYHAKRWGDGKITYRKCYLDAFTCEQRAPLIIGDLYSGALEARAF